MAQIARGLRRAVRARNMIDLVTSSVPRPPRALGTLLPPTPQLLAVVARAGELAPQGHPPTRPRGVRMSLLGTTTVKARVATKIAASASLHPATPPMTEVAAEAQAVPAEALVVQAAPVVPTVEVAAFPGKGTISTGSYSRRIRWQ